MWSILENVPSTLEKNVYSVCFGCNALKISIGSNYSVASLRISVSLLVFCLEDLSFAAAAAAAKSLQLCPTLCDPIDGSPPGSPVPGILRARTLEWLSISFSSAWKWKVKGRLLSCIWLLVTPWTAAYQAPLSMGFSRQEYWSGVPLPSPPLMWVGC